ncbi:NAD-dependent succinate-semialdehyde dehydrogenase [Leucobacter sp. CSA1]|uniref:NAD-dependent succinate-semialdehyde dehydrogenase n=1 Tax=Leucobacter chromiisoli TaxID=2796471 RepID=A0A934Q6A5_9MICO|nr:NAD-dependent succinate-semialdehyde dehydrogenase [Leucobacter chromiisoli]MBK0417474.1 NAD-dependent succinate-semialdehyde dehydrogenase [Leucobacter chromiisoli]
MQDTLAQLESLPGRAEAYVDGTWRPSESGRTQAVLDPATGGEVGAVPAMTAPDVDRAVDAAHRAFGSWRKTTAKERSVLLRRWHDLIGEHLEPLARILTAEQGKPLQEARNEIRQSQAYIEFFSEETRRLYGETIPANTGDRRLLVQREPLGVVGVIAPWNFPAAMIARKAGAALAAGCTVVAKPAAETPLSALALAVLAEAAGIPAGVFNVVTGRGGEIGGAFTAHPLVRKISFTGSTPTGKHLARESADTLKHLSLELGGSAPFIVFDDADVELAVRGVLASKFRNAGQTCVATNRVFVQRGIAEEFSRRFAEETEKLTVGPGVEDGIQIGPLINEGAAEDVGRMLETARSQGARVLAGGERLTGAFVQPTVIADVSDDMDIVRSEIFGPIAPISVFDDTEEAIARANDTVYGLAAYFYTNDYRRIVRVSEGLEFGMVGVNESLTTTEVAPFGGVKDSGYGREGSHFGLEEYTQLKYICVGGL